MARKLQILLCCISIVGGFACKDLYKPDILSSIDSYLVVEGVLNTAAAPTSIRLSRTFKLDDTARVQAERNARVVVEGKDNTTRQLTMTGDGIYTSANLNLVINEEYRLRVTTANGKEYLSDYVVAKKTPSIDSISFREEEKGVQVFASAHDDSNNTRYYRWEYNETWEIRSYYSSVYKYENGVVTRRTPAEYVSVCWKYEDFSRIILSSTAQLQSDIVFRAPLVFIPKNHEKLAVRYSIMVRQYALDKRGYEFYEQMKKNTEGLGTIFDPQPSEIKGNIYCTSDPREVVIGYLSASGIEEQRLFISRLQLRDWDFYQDCPEISIENDPDEIRRAYEAGAAIYNAISGPGGITNYLISLVECVDCTERGGSVIRPTYW